MNIPEEAINKASWAVQDEMIRQARTPDENGNVNMDTADLARAALEAAWAVMHPEVTTVEELDALPSGSIVMNSSEQQVLRNYVGDDEGDDELATWELLGALYQNDPVRSADVIEFGPFTVIHRP